MNGDHLDAATLAALWGAVAFGAVVPVVPTGAAVSAAAVLAGREHWWELLLVVLVGAAGAYTGDLVTYGALRGAGEPLAVRVGWLRPDADEGGSDQGGSDEPGLPGGTRLDRLRASIEQHELRTLLVSRLVPGGRVPVLLVAALTGYSWFRFASAAVGAALLWSLTYSVIGIVGVTLLPDTRTALVVAIVVALVLSVAPGLVRRVTARGRADGAA